jgi:hypothetical protein
MTKTPIAIAVPPRWDLRLPDRRWDNQIGARLS